MEEIAGEADSEEKTGSRCPYCSWLYGPNSSKCGHLLCKYLYIEAQDTLITVNNCPVVVDLFGISTPRAIATRFMNFLRMQDNEKYTVTSQGTRTIDLLHTPNRIATLKNSFEQDDCFHEWTYYFSPSPHQDSMLFESFVKNTYHDQSIPSFSISFSSLHILHNAIMLALSCDSMGIQPARWLMLAGLPDHLPLFLFPFQVNHSGIMYINKNQGHDMLHRMECWHSSPPSMLTIYVLHVLPPLVLNY